MKYHESGFFSNHFIGKYKHFSPSFVCYVLSELKLIGPVGPVAHGKCHEAKLCENIAVD